MPVRPEVRDAQRLLASSAAAHDHAAGRLAQALARRSETLAEQDRLVREAQEALGRSVADMARLVSAELAAELAGLEAAEVRRLAKAHPPTGEEAQEQRTGHRAR